MITVKQNRGAWYPLITPGPTPRVAGPQLDDALIPTYPTVPVRFFADTAGRAEALPLRPPDGMKSAGKK